ncbi:MAG: hypothetical protein K2Q14_04210 [Gammaproteobacteria bacterium]|nr:hypothetical protein [Gammaproteobacteria bacterium]
MANGILAVEPLSRNDISILAQLLEISFDYYIARDSPFFPDYLKSLRTLVGLGLTSVLVVDKGSLCVYQYYFERFMAQKNGDFRTYPHAKTIIAQYTAEMVGTAAICFSALRCPRYYQDFITALYHVIAKVAQFTDRSSEVEHILSKLSVK